jgi:hypothetical protein
VLHQQLARLPGDTRNTARLLAGSLMGTVNAFHRTWAEQGFADDPAIHRDQVMRIFEHGLSAATDPQGSTKSRGTTPGGHRGFPT